MNKMFVVGTGRCGSTLMSNLLKAHPEVLSLSEFFTFITDLGTLIPAAFPNYPITAEQFWDILATPYKKQNLMQKHDICMNEVLYRATSDTFFTLEQGVPAIMQTTLPHLSTEPETLFLELKSFVLTLPKDTSVSLYNATFSWLTGKFEKKIWAERSGGSLRIVHRLYDSFPDAKFLHIVRDGRATALSMQKHYGFRMAMIIFQLTEVLGVDPFEDDNRDWISDLPDDIACFLPEAFDALAFRNYMVDSSIFGYYWSGEVIQGLEEFAKIPREQTLIIKYEDLIEHPRHSIQKIDHFIGHHESNTVQLVEAWINNAVSMIKKPSSSFDMLSSHEQDRLEEACAPGLRALQDAGIDYFSPTMKPVAIGGVSVREIAQHFG